MITKRDKEILIWIEKYGSITINQCAKIFFTNNSEAYDQARKRLQILHKRGLIKRFRKDPKSEAIYYMSRKLKIHDLKIYDVIAEFINGGWKMIEFEKEYPIKACSKKYVLDAFAKFERNNKVFKLILEIDYTHFTGKDKIEDILFQLNYKECKNNQYIFIIVKLTQQNVSTERRNNTLLCYIPWEVRGILNFN